MRSTLKILILVVLTAMAFTMQKARSQIDPNSMSFGANFGLNKYWGEFTDNQFYWGGDIFIRYNIIPQVSVHLSAGLNQLRYKTDNGVIAEYPQYFGENGTEDRIYPNTNAEVVISDLNAVRVNTYELMISYNFFAGETFVPYVFAGAGIMNWEPKSGETGNNGALPNNYNDVYEKTKVIFPAGFGFEVFITQNFALNGKASFRYTGTDYLDDFAQKDSDDDVFLTFGAGASYYILKDTDKDDDGLSDSREEMLGTDPNNPDSDSDGILDGREVTVLNTSPLKPDTDGDNLSDFEEDRDGISSPVKADTDGDGLKDDRELAAGTDPIVSDTDNDGLSDGDEVHKYSTDPLKKDTDQDNLNDKEEVMEYSSNPNSKDTDGDNILDGIEIETYGTNPSVKDTDEDGVSDGLEVQVYKTNPLKPDTDGDKLSDGREINKMNTDPLLADTDGDTVDDMMDDCPHIRGEPKAEKGKNGCPGAPEVGTRTDFPSIHFIVDTDKFNFDYPGTSRDLAKLLEYMQQCRGLSVLIEGHASQDGPADWNQELSEMRADRVKDWLIKQGVNPEKIAGTVGFGERRPKVEVLGNKSEISGERLEKIRETNRRIAIEVVETCSEK